MPEEKKRIFLVDDDEVVLKSLTSLLFLSGFETGVCHDSREAIAKIKIFKPHLILLDLLMPHLGGYEICDLLNKDQELMSIPIIIVSALGGYTDIKKAYQLGVVGYITKPYDFKGLTDKINKIFNYE